MKTTGIRARFVLLAMFLVATSANASFHLWRMTEVYSNADGTVQFLELAALASGEQFVSGHTLTSTRGTVSNSFTVPTDLPGDSGGKRMLFATQGFANLGVVTPDYILPNGFFFPAGGSINWADVDLWVHPALPTDGRMSLDKETGAPAINSPRNFFDQTGSVTAPTAAALVYQGLWWRSPAASESGWGINVTHQGDILFATWFTYDTDGSGMWIVMARGEKSGANAWTGKLYRTTGPSFSSIPFDPSKVVAAEVGTGTFTFTSADTGSFAYTLNGVTQTKPIMRETFDSPVPTCTAGGTQGASVNFQDLWWRSPAASESGWGINITHQGDVIFATWFTYGADGKGVWIVMAHGTKTAANTYSGTLYRTTGPAFSATPFDPARVVATQVGSGTFTFSDASNGTFAYTVDGISQSKPIMREVYASPVSVCK